MARDEAPLLGRDAELRALCGELFRAAEGRPAAAAVIGAVGVGKSRLARALAAAWRERTGGKVLSVVARPEDELAPLGVMRRLLGEDVPPGRLPADAEIRAALAYAARRAPLLVVVDDAHLADEPTLDVIEALAHGEVEAPLALLLLAEPSIAARRPRLRGAFPLALSLAPLRSEAGQALAARLLGPAAVPDTVTALAEAAGGVPLLLEELALDLGERDDGASVRRAGLDELVTARLGRLPPAARVALAATWLGDPAGQRLDQLQLLEAGAFTRHRALGELAYLLLAPEAKRALHEALAAEAHRRLATREDVVALVALALHLDGAGRRDEAAECFVRAAVMTGARRVRGDAHRLWARALTMLRDAVDAVRLVAAAQAALDAGQAAESIGLLARALAQAECTGVLRAHALHVRAGAHADLGAWVPALGDARAGLAEVETAGGELAHPLVAARLHGLCGWVLGYECGDTAAGVRHSLRAVELLEGRSEPEELAVALRALGANYLRLGRSRDHVSCKRRTLDLARAARQPDLEALSLLNLGVSLTSLGEHEEALAHTRAARALYQELHDARGVALSRNNLALGLLAMGRDDEASVELSAALLAAERLQYQYFRAEAECTAARLAVRRGDLREGRLRAEAGVVWARAEDAQADEAMARRVLGAVLSLAGEHQAALAALDAAQVLATGADLLEEARVLAQRARTLRRAGAADEARVARDGAEAALRALSARDEIAHLDDADWI